MLIYDANLRSFKSSISDSYHLSFNPLRFDSHFIEMTMDRWTDGNGEGRRNGTEAIIFTKKNTYEQRDRCLDEKKNEKNANRKTNGRIFPHADDSKFVSLAASCLWVANYFPR
uniref:Uncharacterized protein n=1 Tax=Steinernema glaseri TaxID=37863 RepID=A0A1I8AMR3_9BILA